MSADMKPYQASSGTPSGTRSRLPGKLTDHHPAANAQSLGGILGRDVEQLRAAAMLHDIGYTPSLATTGFHPLDGARYLRDHIAADERLGAAAPAVWIADTRIGRCLRVGGLLSVRSSSAGLVRLLVRARAGRGCGV
jgi:predicted hydrolase (HD superfamily)